MWVWSDCVNYWVWPSCDVCWVWPGHRRHRNGYFTLASLPRDLPAVLFCRRQSPQELTPALLTTASSLSPPVSVASSISQALDLLASSNQAVVMEAILTSCNKALQSGKAAAVAVQFLVKLLLQSPRLCNLVAGDVLKLGWHMCVCCVCVHNGHPPLPSFCQ